MAEIGLAASIMSLAAFGASVATTLYQTADIMKNADQQIRALAKHVTQFTAVLNHIGQVLKTEKTNCSKEVIRDIRKIKHSSKGTFREIMSIVKAKRFRRFVWLFKRTKAMELEARLDSQQSMLQCMIHTLTVSKLSHMDSRSKEDSEHITGVKVEIKLLKTFIKESYDNLMALRRAEQSTEAEARHQPIPGDGSHPAVQHPHINGSTFPSNPIGVASNFETRSTSPTPNFSKSGNEDEDSDDGSDDDDDDFSSTKSKDRNEQGSLGPKDETLDATGVITGVSVQPRQSYKDSLDAKVHRESNLLLQMVPYRPEDPDPIRSNRLILVGQGLDSGTRITSEEATDSVRLLLDKWTTSGSAPISNILDDEAAKENHEADLANKRRFVDPPFDRDRWPSNPGAKFNGDSFGPTDDRGSYEHAQVFGDYHMPLHPPLHHMPLHPPLHHPQPPYQEISPRERNFWRPSHHFSQLPDRQLGDEILTALRSTRGGIHYILSNQFRRVHYVDRYPIYTCALVPSHMVLLNEDKLLNTELPRALIRREALDLLAYSYTRADSGDFLISDNLELEEIEELVNLSYQALDRSLKQQSKTIIKERGWSGAVDSLNRGVPRMRSTQPWAAPQYIPSSPEPCNLNAPLHNGYCRHGPEYPEYEEIVPYGSTPAQAPPPRVNYSGHPSAVQIVIAPPSKAELQEQERQEQDAIKATHPEVRFTLPRAHLASGTADTAKEAPPIPVKPEAPTTKTDDELQRARQRLERVKIRKEEAEKRKDIAIAAELKYHVIPDLELQVEELMKRQREEQEKSAAPMPQNEDEKRPLHTEVETESEYSDDEGGSEAEALYE